MFTIGMVIESLVAVLLMLTIGYCMLLNRRLTKLRADEGAFRNTIIELVAATETAERAIVNLRVAASECDQTLGQTVQRGEQMIGQLDERLAGGGAIIKRLIQIAQAARASYQEQGGQADEGEEPGETVRPVARMASAASEAAARLAEYRRQHLRGEAA